MNLTEINTHPRDQNITFYEDTHTYVVKDNPNKFTSVTTLIHKYFPHFNPDKIIKNMTNSKNWISNKYYGQTPDEIKTLWKDNGDSASKLGTAMHLDIENFYNDLPVLNPDCKEFQMFMNFWTDFQKLYPDLKIFRTEWIVYDEDIKVSGSIDCILEDQDKNLYVLDWKRSKEIKFTNTFRNDNKGYSYFAEFDNCNYCHYSLQLNIYRTILELKYDRKIAGMMLVILHPNQDAYQCIKVNHIELGEIWGNINNF